MLVPAQTAATSTKAATAPDLSPFHLPDDVAQALWHVPAVGDRDARAVRRHRFDAGRACAADLLSQLGSSSTVVTAHADGAPQWPPDFVGSITHSGEHLAVVVASAQRYRALGIDMEPLLSDSVADEIRTTCFAGDELTLAGWGALSPAQRASAGFCAKEAFYKCLYPLVRRFFDFHEADICAVEGAAGGGRLTLRLASDLSAQWRRGFALGVDFRIAGGVVYASAALPAFVPGP